METFLFQCFDLFLKCSVFFLCHLIYFMDRRSRQNIMELVDQDFFHMRRVLLPDTLPVPVLKRTTVPDPSDQVLPYGCYVYFSPWRYKFRDGTQVKFTFPYRQASVTFHALLKFFKIGA